MQNRARLYSYYGGKHRMIKEILDCIPACKFDVYLELYFGSGAAFFALEAERYQKAVVNDLDDGVAHLLKMLQSEEIGEILFEQLKKIKVDEIAFRNAKYEEKHYFKNVDDITKAVMVYQLISQSFNAGRGSYRKGMNQKCYTRQLISGIPSAMDKLRGNVQIENRNAVELIQEYREEEGAFFFLDPPYVPSTRKKGATKVYKQEMTEFEHAQMLCAVRDVRGRVMICGYPHALYDELLNGSGWHRYELKEVSKPSANRKGRQSERAVEVVWCNYEVPSRE